MLHITIGTAPEMPPSLNKDLRMVKAILLYADKVKLCSAGYSTWMPEFLNKHKTNEQLIEESYKMEKMIPILFAKDKDFFEPSEKLPTVIDAIKFHIIHERIARKLLVKENLLPEEANFIKTYKEINSSKYEYIAKLFPTLNLEAANNEFEIAVKAGLLEIHRFKVSESEDIGFQQVLGNFDATLRKISQEFLDIIMETVKDAKTYPLFDDEAGGLVDFSVKVGLETPTQTRIAQGKQSKLAENILSRLPLFEEASMDEILDIRKELERPLIRFRSAIIKYAEKIKSESWSKEFTVEAEETFLREIEPTVIDIEDLIKSNSSLLALSTRKLVDKPAIASLVSTSFLSFFVASQITLPAFANYIMAAGSIGTAAATAFFDAYKESQKQKLPVEQNQLYFYYKAGKLLSK